jgi:uncharacterized protein (TIGR02001 family)
VAEDLSKLPILRLTLLLAVVAGAVPAAFAQGRVPALDAYLTLANDHRSRGLSVLESGMSWQIGFDYEFRSGFFAGANAANLELAAETGRADRRERALDYYAGYGWGERAWEFNVALGRYTYPGYALDYDYTELRFAAMFMQRLFYNVSYVENMLSSPYSAWHHEVGLAHPLRGDLEFSAAVGRFDGDGALGGYTHWNAGLSKVIRRFGMDLRYYDAGLDSPSYLGSPRGDRWVLSVSYGFPL